MTARKVVVVERAACNACGSCITACPWEALHLVDGAVRLVNEVYCSGDGHCVKACGGALFLDKREAAPFDRAAAELRLERRARLRALAED